MKLIIDNIAKIEHAEVRFDGITVICGRNDAGKSTLGKVLFATFNALKDMDRVIKNERYHDIRDVAERMLIESGRDELSAQSRITRSRKMAEWIAREVVVAIEEADGSSYADILRLVLGEEIAIQTDDDIIAKLTEEILEILNFPEDRFLRQNIDRWYAGVFNGQISRLGTESDGRVKLVIKEKEIKLAFHNHSCEEAVVDIPIIHRAFLVDDPHVVDDLSYGIYPVRRRFTRYDPRDFLKNWLSNKNENADSIVASVQAKEKLEEVDRLLAKAIPGEIVEKNSHLFLRNEAYESGVMIENLSMGLKSLFIIKRLLEQNALLPKDVIIFDEPEIHLHPEWQVLYAQILVLLQRAFDLTLVVTTHSHYFLEALDLYSRMYDREGIVHYYLADAAENRSSFTEVTGHLEDIYGLMADPITLLDNLRIEIQNKKEA